MRCDCGQENDWRQNQCPRCNRRLFLGTNPRRLAIDASAAVALALALILVMCFDRHKVANEESQPVENVSTSTEEIVGPEGSEPLAARPLRLAVTPPEFDDMGKLLGTLGEGYRHTEIAMDDLLDATRLAKYDVVFLTCSGAPRSWLGQRLEEGDRGSSGIFEVRKNIIDRLKTALRKFVGGGGTLYASDWQFQLVSVAFPEFVDHKQAARGGVQTVHASVLDEGLQRHLGATIDLRFDKTAWRVAAFKGPDVAVYLRGKYTTVDGEEASGPLLVQFPFENGTVIFTSFHNEAQNNELETKLLRYLVFATVTAHTEATIKRTMVRGGFSPVERNLLSASPADQSINQKYECQAVHDLQFVLGFEDLGAELQMTVTAPDGQQFEKHGTSTLVIDVPGAAAGTWSYRVTPVKVPYANFPFTLTVGEKR